MAYATVADLTAAIGVENVPADAQRLLDKASRLVDSLMVGVLYATDDSGNPTDVDAIAAFKDATISQVEFWASGAGSSFGNADTYALAMIGSVRLQKGSNVATTGANINGMVVAPDTLAILRNSGALPIYPTYWG